MSDITIISHKRTNNFTIVPNHIINATYLSLEEKMLLIWILSKPDDWKVSTTSMAKIHSVGRNKITLISKNLQKWGHLFIKKDRMGHAHWYVFENKEDHPAHDKNTPVTPVSKPYPQFEHNPDPQKPDLANETTLLRTDLLQRTDQEKTSSSKAEHIGIEFAKLWYAWPNAKNKIRSETAFNAKTRSMSPNAITKTVNGYKIDIQKRLEAQQLGFNNMMLSTYLNNERYNDDITNANNDSISELDAGQAASDAKSRELFR